MTKAEREALKAEFITGDYRTIKEFAERKGISYNTLRKIGSVDGWLGSKLAHEAQISKELCTKAQEKRVEDALRDATARQNVGSDIACARKGIKTFRNGKVGKRSQRHSFGSVSHQRD